MLRNTKTKPFLVSKQVLSCSCTVTAPPAHSRRNYNTDKMVLICIEEA